MGTIRENIIALLRQQQLDAREISGRIGVSEKDVVQHLIHVSKSISRQGLKLNVKPARCLACGYSFRDRRRPKKPGRCPLCKSEHIDPPRFEIG